jgi:hypothetical protein
MRAALRNGGRVAAIVYSTPDRNRFFSIPVSIIRRRASLPPPLPGQPGPFSLGAPGVLEEAFEKAGYRDIDVRVVEAPLHLASAAECVRFEQEAFGALHQMLSGLDESARKEAWVEIETELSQFEGPDGSAGPCEPLRAAAGTQVVRLGRFSGRFRPGGCAGSGPGGAGRQLSGCSFKKGLKFHFGMVASDTSVLGFDGRASPSWSSSAISPKESPGPSLRDLPCAVATVTEPSRMIMKPTLFSPFTVIS